jgi:23S rRNA pseudouridine1911/1915/1917 synthase
MSPPVRTLVADRGDAGVRLDLVLRRHLTDVGAATRTRVQRWIEGGHVTVNGAAVRRASARAALGDIVAVVLPDRRPRRAMAAEDFALEILDEDDYLLALNKPPGIVVHPTFGHATGTIMNALLARAGEWPVGRRPSIVGRLDKGTSGIVLVAKTRDVHRALQRALSADLTGCATREPIEKDAQRLGPAKDYLAVVYGRVPRRGTIDLRLRLDPGDRRRTIASAASGARSVTEFERLACVRARGVGLALLRCRLITGRRHQIRAHLAARGWPIVGDPTYGDPRWTRVDDPVLAAGLHAMPRQALHAWRLAFQHPIADQPVRIEAPLPRDMADLIARSGLAAGAGAVL